jgi:protein phosphatase
MTSSLSLEVWCQTDVGLKREHNEDSFLFDKEIGLYSVADGMGGHRGGEVASRMAVESLRDVVQKAVKSVDNNQGAQQQRPINPRPLLTRAYQTACRTIHEASHKMNLVGMGTTLVSAFFTQNTVYIANVGDSRAYLISQGHMWQLTEDHSLLSEKLRAGLISEAEIAKSTPRNVITRSVGFEEDVQVDLLEKELQDGDMLLLCSDGLSGLVSDKRIFEICSTNVHSNIVSICINEAKLNGGDDNVTVMLLCAQLHTN